MLASKYRLKKRMNFARCEIDGRLIQSRSFGVEIYDRKDKDNSRFGFIISTRISKKAVVRNKIKRTISDYIRININMIKNGLDVVFLIKPAILKLNKEQIENEIYEIIIKNLQK
ncbi:ribonuclease P protein component [Candidatus Woesebacteria bacterium GWC2_33_12]|uniref:Ribonuclease P protein component n=1 Tax=Candidatus Woesebacteria bacterium GW2011_GWB1_33_22 TaxID=1618566 RepID=A0A0G0BZH1_9BACT|nr:MAG: Ribonuclease P protein component [Candidatus Woesebacteria bacterium GW2011_GWC2_33_12]KKP41832.1 MAG: Ribonuclease P protein component [Candidatus Woesebacteria bacterium GW2011_GWA2_33_20]KKP44310.1 MAG: Ribonuclease P protein component [Candidatus Woesebacteria bacterium GW2011_GWB1_33_22]KKP46068.1 MAG: Ribonuclease P protein component [Microgenomates group bacterium GW2011_GWC1_33_28]KKP49958.1 MAG: Ribonuclease P protein component [Candidatus Woesebacteria bacterium GW2011_GWA1_33